MVATKEEQLAELIAKATQIAQQTNAQSGVYVAQGDTQSSVVNEINSTTSPFNTAAGATTTAFDVPAVSEKALNSTGAGYGSILPETIIPGSPVDQALKQTAETRNLYAAEEEQALKNFPGKNAWNTPLRQMEQRTGNADSALNPVHIGHMTVLQCPESKSAVFMSGAPGESFIAIEHGPSNSYIEIKDNGDIITNSRGTSYHISAKDNKVLVQGTCHVSVTGDCLLEVNGDRDEYVKGNYNLRVDGEYNFIGKQGIYGTAGGDIKFAAGGGPTSTSAITLDAPGQLQNIFLNSEVFIAGALNSETISSTGAVTATGGMFVGLGGIVCAGGIKCGIPAPTGGIPGVIDASLAVKAPLGAFLMVRDFGGFLMSLRMKYNTHKHLTKFGLTKKLFLPDPPMGSGSSAGGAAAGGAAGAAGTAGPSGFPGVTVSA
jgi:hypothetical protein